ncbi:MAG: hypothetical protein JSS50_03830 [Proteobacteria bacterium]|nr:hypothetical protein [Pseudomonadota bacterium]
MLANIFQFLHIAPLAVIVVALVAFMVMRGRSAVLSAERLLGLLVGACAVGISAGSVLHHDAIALFFDPCIGYSLTLCGVAVALLQRNRASSRAL